MSKLTKTALQRKKAVEDEILIPADNEQAARFEDAKETLVTRRRALELAQLGGEEAAELSAKLRVDNAKLALEEVKEEIRKTGTAITLRGVGRVRWDELRIEHAATEAMQAEDAEKPADEKRDFNPETFWPALLAETADGDLTPEDWTKLVLKSKEWSPTEIEELKIRASAVNQGSRIVELGN